MSADRAGAQEIVPAIWRRWLWLEHSFDEGAFDRAKLLDATALRDLTIEIIRRFDDVSGFMVLTRRADLRLVDALAQVRPRL